MAKRRLNKKVALVGSMIFIVVVLGGILAILYLSRDPAKFIEEGDAAWQAKDYKKAERCYHKARSLARDDKLRNELLFKLVDLYIQTDEWRMARGCWEEIISTDTKDVKARYARLKYFHIMADSGVRQVWQDVRQQASELITIVEQANLSNENTAKWETAGLEIQDSVGLSMSQYLHLIRGKAAIEMAKLGIVPDTEALLAEGVKDLENVQNSKPDNVDAHWYLAQAEITKGDILTARGNLEGRDKAVEQARLLTEQAVKVADADPKAHMNYLLVKLMGAYKGGKEQLDAIEKEYLAMGQRFPNSAEVFARISRFYSDPRLAAKNLDKAIEAIEQAIKLDKDNVAYALNAAHLRYRKFSYFGKKEELDNAIQIAKQGLTLPGAQEETGPRSWEKRLNRVSLYILLANSYIENILENRDKMTEADIALCLKEAEQAVYGIEQILGSGEDPQVVKWRGMLELAKGDTSSGVRKLYAAYEQLKASSTQKGFERVDSLLAYRLAKVFENSDEIGAANEYFAVALRLGDRSVPDKIDERKPEAFLDYAELLMKLRVYNEALHLVNYFESQYWSNARSRKLRIKAYIGAKQFDSAAEELANIPDADAADTVKLGLELVQAKIRQTLMAIAQKKMQDSPGIVVQAITPQGQSTEPKASMKVMEDELKSYRKIEADLVKKLLAVQPALIEAGSVIAVCKNYVEDGRKAEAEGLVSRYITNFPNDISVLVYKNILSEPDAANVSEQRRREIDERVFSGIADPLRRAVELGTFYRKNDQFDKAAGQFTAALEMGASGGSQDLNRVKLAAGYLFEIALTKKDWQLANQMVERAQRDNLDDCAGHIFASRLAFAKGRFQDALVSVDEALKLRPVFSRAYLHRSNINMSLGDDSLAAEDIKKAASLNPMDGIIAKSLAIALYKRDQKLGKEAAPSQMIETKGALDKAMFLNTGDLQLLGFYADYISSSEPLRALAIRQDLQKSVPSVQNAVKLGQLATKVALEQTDKQRRDALLNVAQSTFEDALKLNPGDKEVLYYYAEHLRARGQDDKAKSLLEQSQQDKLLWDHYFQRGQYDDAKKVLEQLYQGDAKDVSVLKGLLLVAERTGDADGIKKYSEELLVVEGTAENYLIQIQSFLRIGLVKEAELKVQSFKEKYQNEPRIQLLEALLVMRQGQLQKALELTNKYLQGNQKNAVAWRLRGEINFYLGDYEPSISDLKASKALVDDPVTRITLAKAYLRIQRIEDAITELKNTIDAPAAPAEARRLLEQLYLELGRKEALKELYEQTLAKFPYSALWLNRAAGFAVMTGEFDKAEQLFLKAYQMKRPVLKDPNDKNQLPDVQYASAFDGYLKTLVLSAGDPNSRNWNPKKLDKVFEESRRHLDTALAPVAYLRMAEAKILLGDKKAAIDYCRKAVEKSGANENLAAEVLLRMYLMLGPDEVSKYCEQRLRANPDLLSANFTMFNLARINGQYNKAVDYIDKCINIVGQDNPRVVDYVAKKAEILTLAYDRTSDNNYLLKAIADYESLLAKMPNNISVLNNLAYMLAENNERLPEALQYAKRALDASPNDPTYMDTYGYVLFKNGKVQEAAEVLTAALQQYEQGEFVIPPEVYEHVGMIKEKLGAKTEALDAYKRALEVGAERLPQKRREQIDKAVKRLSQ